MPQTAGEWAQVLQLQRQFHQVQLSKWQQILQSSVTLLDQVGVFFVLFLNDAHYRSLFAHACLGISGLLQYMCSSPSFFTYQMKQSLEKLHSGIRVPELQQDAPDDPLTETLTEAWVFCSALQIFPSWSTWTNTNFAGPQQKIIYSWTSAAA